MSYFDFPHTRNYDTDLGFLISEYKKLVRLYEELKDLQKDYIDSEIKKVIHKIDIDIANVDVLLKQYADDQDKILEQKLIKEIKKVDARVTQFNFDLRNKIDQDIKNLKNYTDGQDAQIIDYIDNKFIEVKVTDPVTGQPSSIQQVLNSLFGLHRDDALTASEYDNKQITASNYDKLSISAIDYDTRGKKLVL